ncbi:MAG: alpha-E domain-containing protein [Nitrospirota bacterium]
MLSRTADHLYWMARYMQRAENTARILDVTNRMSLLPKDAAVAEREWRAALAMTACDDAFAARGDQAFPRAIIRFMTLDPDNPSSIVSCVRTARESARAVRGTITTEMWESLNTTWLEIQQLTLAEVDVDDIGARLDWIKERSHLFDGVTLSTILHDEALQFIRLGTFLERAENTARVLDVKYHLVLSDPADVAGAVDYYQWGALLRSVSAFEAYRKVYRDVIVPWRVAELLILRADMPRSLHACFNEIDEVLARMPDETGREAARRAGDLHARLHYGRMEEILQQGLHDYLQDFLSRVNDLGREITHSFLVPACG